jgi:ribosomal-protein-alanine N-acetyltransferase
VSERIELIEGFIEFHQVSDFADIHDVQILVEFRGNGYGTRLMTLFLDEMKKRSVTEVTLEVRVDNMAAIGLYEKIGFERIAIRKAYYKDGCDGLLMRLEMKR